MMIRKLVTARIALTLGISLTVLACTADDVQGDGAGEAEGTEEAETGDGDGDSGDGDGDSGDGDSGDGDSGDGDGDGDGDSGDGDGDSGDGDSGDGDGDSGDGDGDSGDGDGDSGVFAEEIEQACNASCEQLSTCVAPLPGCEEGCIDTWEDAVQEESEECMEALLAETHCAAMLSCEEYFAYLEGDFDGPCGEEKEASWTCR